MKRTGKNRLFPTLGLLVILVAGAGLAIISCYVNPATGKEELSFVSEGREIQMGRESDQAISAQLGIYPDPDWQAYVTKVGQSLAAVSERPGLPWSFKVIDDPTVNAFALPGGFIYVTRGMLYHCQDEAQLAGVIGHEIGHVTARHSVSQITKQQLAQIGLAGATLIEPGVEKYGQLITTGLGLLFLKFSRNDEKQADHLGLRYMTRGGYDPRHMDDIFLVLQRLSENSGSGRMPIWMSTHPDPADRVNRIRQEVDTIRGDLSGRRVGHEEYLGRIDGLVYGIDPREGFFEGNTFYQPQMAFRFDFPDGWQTLNQKQGVLGASPEEDAIIQITLSDAATPAEAASRFLGQQGITSSGAAAASINGLRAASGEFSAATESGALKGNVTFVQYGGRVFQILGYTTAVRWWTYKGALDGAIGSFIRLTDQSKLSVEPLRIRSITLDRDMSVIAFNDRYPSAVPLERIALINQVSVGDIVPQGSVLKQVVGEPVGR